MDDDFQTKSRVEILNRLYLQEGLSVAEIARRLGITPKKTFDILKENHPHIRYRREKIPLKEKLSKSNLKQMLQNKMSNEKIATKLKVSSTCVSKLRKEYGLSNTNRKKKIKTKYIRKFSPRKIFMSREQLEDLYHNQKKTSRQIAKIYKVSKAAVLHMMKRLGIKRREPYNRQRKYTINQKFFHKWTPEMAYVLGWLFTDGCISSDRDLVSLIIKDRDILEKIRNEMGSNHPLRFDKRREIYTLAISSSTLVNQLKRLGLKPRKSLTTEFPVVPNGYLSHFLRGVYEGDGTICFIPRQSMEPYPMCAFVSGSRKFISTLSKKIYFLVNLNQHVSQRNHSVYHLYYQGNDCVKVLRCIYERNNGLRLERKYTKFERACELMKNRKRIPWNKDREILPTGLKRCQKCKQIKRTNEFYKDRNAWDGFHRWCTTCSRGYNKKWHKEKGINHD